MASDPEIRRNIRGQLFASVSELADLAFQKATWLDPEMRNPHFTYSEFCESFYDVVGGSYDEADPHARRAPLHHLVQSGFISAAERDAVWPLHIALKDFRWPGDPYDHKAILADAGWQDICAIARSVRAKLLALISDPEERACFEVELPTAAEMQWPSRPK